MCHVVKVLLSRRSAALGTRLSKALIFFAGISISDTDLDFGDTLFPRKFLLRLEAELKGGDEPSGGLKGKQPFLFYFCFNRSVGGDGVRRAPRHRLPTKRGPLLPLLSASLSPADRDFRGYNNGRRATLAALNPMDGHTAAAADP